MSRKGVLESRNPRKYFVQDSESDGEEREEMVAEKLVRK